MPFTKEFIDKYSTLENLVQEKFSEQNLKKIKALLSDEDFKKNCYEIQDNNHNNLLHFVCEKSDSRIAQVIFDQLKTDQNKIRRLLSTENKDGCNPILLTIKNRKEDPMKAEVLTYALNIYGNDAKELLIEKKIQNHRLPIWIAINKKIETLRAILQAKSLPNDYKKAFITQPLTYHMVFSKKDISLLDLVIEKAYDKSNVFMLELIWPYVSPFKIMTVNEVQPGDMIYGLNAPRSAVVKILKKYGSANSFYIFNSISLLEAGENDVSDFIKFVTMMGHKKYIPQSPTDDNIPKIECKLGILWAKYRNKKIYFVINDLEYDFIQFGARLRKNEYFKDSLNDFKTQGSWSSRNFKFTEAEITFIYKYYSYLSDTVVFCRINADSLLEKVPPPWEYSKLKSDWQKWLKGNFRGYKLNSFVNAMQQAKSIPELNQSTKNSGFFATFKKRKSLYSPIYAFREHGEFIRQLICIVRPTRARLETVEDESYLTFLHNQAKQVINNFDSGNHTLEKNLKDFFKQIIEESKKYMSKNKFDINNPSSQLATLIINLIDMENGLSFTIKSSMRREEYMDELHQFFKPLNSFLNELRIKLFSLNVPEEDANCLNHVNKIYKICQETLSEDISRDEFLKKISELVQVSQMRIRPKNRIFNYDFQEIVNSIGKNLSAIVEESEEAQLEMDINFKNPA